MLDFESLYVLNKGKIMNTDKKWNLLFIQDDRSIFDSDTKMFNELFKRVDKALGKEEALTLFDNNQYDIVLGDLSVEPRGCWSFKTDQRQAT